MPYLSSIAALTADRIYPLDEIFEAARVWLKDKQHELELFQRFHTASRTKGRSYVLPLSDILSLAGQTSRAEIFTKYGLPLACKTIKLALDRSQMKPSEIDSVVWTSCTCPLIPSLDAEVLQRMDFSPNVRRIPIYQQGCAGGVVGLSLANQLAKSDANTLLISVELCSLLFRFNESGPVDILGAALFADGAAASVISPSKSNLKVIAARSHLISETTHLMGYNIHDDGPHLNLDRELPSVLQEILPSVVRDFAAEIGLQIGDIPWWIIHPGGVKILDGIASLLSLKEDQYRWSYEILSDVGNISSATVQFVLSRFLDSNHLSSGDNLMMIGIGPGLTIELIAFTCG